MANLTSKSASESYKIVHDLLDNLKCILIDDSRYENVLTYMLSEKNGNLVAKEILSEENAHSLTKNVTKEMLVILKYLGAKIENKHIVSKAAEILYDYEEKFNLHLEYMQIRNSGLKWNFLSSGLRYEVETLYDEISKLLNSGLSQQVYELRVNYIEPCNVTDEDVIEYYNKNSKEIRKILKCLLNTEKDNRNEFPKLVKNKK